MMKFILLFLVAACTFGQKNHERYAVIDRLWHEKATIDQVIKKLGSDYEQKHEGIIYRSSGKSIESGHFFDSSGRLTVQFLFVPREKFKDLKKIISCSWNEKSESKNIGHTIHTIESGKCASENITYEYRPSMLLYEFRWESK
ncbi:MAG: hypothetical protein NDI69_08090 [Bacteriovoracaceae bacterium]|nr:hypothetical protein [Bacteriovoracaceae bacterium]